MTISEEIKYGETLLNKGQYEAALKSFQNILNGNELNYQALNYIAITYSMLKEYDKAIYMLNKAANHNPSLPNAFLNLAIILFQKGNREEALDYYKKVIELDPENTTAYYNYAVALEELDRFNEAIVNYEKAIEKNKDNYSAYYNWGALNLLLGKYKNGWDGYEYRAKAKVLRKRDMPGKKWDGENIEDKTLYIYSDQGFGDTIQFFRFLPIIKEKVGKLIFECQPALFQLLKECSMYDEIVQMDKSLKPVVDYDYYLPITSLGKILNVNEKYTVWEKPYIAVDKTDSNKLSDIFSNTDKKKIGIVWRSNSNYKYENRRAISLSALKENFEINGIEWFSLQMEPTADELQILNKYNIKDLSSHINDFNDTAEIIEQLDLIISTDTAVPHLAGAMGKEVWLMLSNKPDWRWQLNKSESVWYPSFKLLRQKENWNNVIDTIKAKLKQFSDREIFDDKGMKRFKKFLYKIKDETYPEAPLEMHTVLSDKMIVKIIGEAQLPKNARILDIGCGQGLGLKKFSEYGYNPIGITLNNTDFEICKNKGYEVYQMDQSFLQFEDEAFDLLWARHVLEHSIFPYYTLHEYARVIKNDGLIYAEVPAAGFDAVHEKNPNHYSVLNKQMWTSLFNRAGLKIVFSWDYNAPLLSGGNEQYWMYLLTKNKNKNE